VLTRFVRPKKPSTLAIDAGRIESHIKPLIGPFIARDLSSADVQRMADDIAAGKTAVVAKSDKKRVKAVVTGGPVTAARVVELSVGFGPGQPNESTCHPGQSPAVWIRGPGPRIVR
jgi:hypothetical protein